VSHGGASYAPPTEKTPTHCGAGEVQKGEEFKSYQGTHAPQWPQPTNVVLLQVGQKPRRYVQTACASRECLPDQRCNLVTQQLDRAHDMPVLHAEPLDTGDQPVAACSPHQINNICGAFLRRADNEAVVDEVLEFGVGFRVTDDSSEKAPIAKDTVDSSLKDV
jgi:hypothetical protein